jgi:hypothetical protein
MLLRNGTVLNQYPLRQLGGGVHADITMFNRNERRNIYSGITDLKSGIPNGHVAPSSWLLPLKPGGMSSFNYAIATFTATGAALMGVTSPATSSITFTVDGTGSLITSGEGSASFSIATGTPDLLASLSGDGTATFTISGDGVLDGHGFMDSTTSMTITGTLVAYATGSMEGSTLNGAALSEASILAAMNANPPCVNIKLVNDVVVNGTGSLGDEWGP